MMAWQEGPVMLEEMGNREGRNQGVFQILGAEVRALPRQ